MRTDEVRGEGANDTFYYVVIEIRRDEERRDSEKEKSLLSSH